jgi:antitoxin (DNA-binding transcriptional repressor) of toxin-antitoxin stability system
MPTPEAVSPRDLRTRGREIFDAVEHGRAFTLTRDGHEIGELIPIRRRRTFVSRENFRAMSIGAPTVDIAGFRADQDAHIENYLFDE